MAARWWSAVVRAAIVSSVLVGSGLIAPAGDGQAAETQAAQSAVSRLGLSPARAAGINWRGALTVSWRGKYVEYPQPPFGGLSTVVREESGTITYDSFVPNPNEDRGVDFLATVAPNGAGRYVFTDTNQYGCVAGLWLDWSTSGLSPESRSSNAVSIYTPDVYAGWNGGFESETKPLLSLAGIEVMAPESRAACTGLGRQTSDLGVSVFGVDVGFPHWGVPNDYLRINDTDPDPDRIVGETTIALGDDGQWIQDYYRPNWPELMDCAAGGCLTDYSMVLSYDLTRVFAPDCSKPSKDPVYCYAPTVLLHPDEITFPIDVTTFVEKSRLIWNRDHGCKDEVVASTVVLARLGYEAEEPYRAQESGGFPRCKESGQTYASNELTKPGAADKPKGLDKEEGFYLDLDDTWRLGSRPVDGQVRTGAYYSLSDDGRHITYWFMYGFNQGAPGAGARVDRHEGEWERVTVDLNADNTARQVRFWQHECSSPETVPYNDIEVDGTHPVVYAALGSHASFSNVRTVGKRGLCPLFGQQKVGQGWGDRTAQGGPVWKTWDTSLQDAAKQLWYGFGGAWGEIGGNEKLGGSCDTVDDILKRARSCAISVTGPLGPAHKNLFAYP